jgi:predicted secreted protein
MSHRSFQGKSRWMAGLTVALAVGLTVGLVASACSSAAAKTADLGATCDQLGTQKSVAQQADVAVGEVLKVNLCSNPTTGFSWQEPAISDAAVISLVDKTFSAAKAGGTTPAVGAAGTDTVTLKATAKGTSTVVLKYSQPWPGGTTSEWMYTLTVTVR